MSVGRRRYEGLGPGLKVGISWRGGVHASDSARRTRVIVYGLIFWSVATGFSSLANGLAMMLAFRGLVAFGEAFY